MTRLRRAGALIVSESPPLRLLDFDKRNPTGGQWPVAGGQWPVAGEARWRSVRVAVRCLPLSKAKPLILEFNQPASELI